MNMSVVASDSGFLLVAPDGTMNPRGERFWNAGDICCDFYGSNVNDEQFLVDLIEMMIRKHNVDRSRVYLVGHSNGGAMAYRMACRQSKLITAMVSLAGIGQDDVNSCTLTRPVGVLHIHGTADEEVNFNGGLRFGKPYISVSELLSRWARSNSCAPTSIQMSTVHDLVRNIPGSDTRVSSWLNCALGVKTELWTTTNGVHVPPLTSEFSTLVYSFLSAHSM
jgi:polyhydroxybutyrate depolymerase